MRWPRATTPSGSTTTAGAPASARRRAAARAPRRASGGRAPLQPREHPNPLIGAFAALLAFAPELEVADRAERPRDAAHPAPRRPDHRPRRARSARGVPLARADAGAWAVAALLDDLALNTPWGGASAWPRQPLVSTLYGDVDAGARFFDRLEELERHPTRDPEMLELLYFCLALGFRGRYRVPGRAGARSLAAVRTAAARLLRDPEAAQAPLSPNWQGVVAADDAAPLRRAALGALRRRRRRRRRDLPRRSRCGSPARPSSSPSSPARCRRPSAPRSSARPATPRPPPAPAAEASRLRAPARVRGRGAPKGLLPALKGERDASRSPRSSSSGPTPSSSARPRAELTDGLRAADRLDRPGDRREPGADRQRHRRRPHRQHPGQRRQPLRRQPGPERGARRHHRRASSSPTARPPTGCAPRAAPPPSRSPPTRRGTAARSTAASRSWSRSGSEMVVFRLLWAFLTSRWLWTLIGLALLGD